MGGQGPLGRWTGEAEGKPAPNKVPHDPPENGGRSIRGQNTRPYRDHKKLEDLNFWKENGQPPAAEARTVDWRPAKTLVEDIEAVKVEKMSIASTLMEEAACSQGRGQS
jgi:hypothetical protein